MHALPYVIDNDRHRLADVLNQVLADHRDLALDVATAYFNVGGRGRTPQSLTRRKRKPSWRPMRRLFAT
jgi:hypothetical protein